MWFTSWLWPQAITTPPSAQPSHDTVMEEPIPATNYTAVYDHGHALNVLTAAIDSLSLDSESCSLATLYSSSIQNVNFDEKPADESSAMDIDDDFPAPLDWAAFVTSASGRVAAFDAPIHHPKAINPFTAITNPSLISESPVWPSTMDAVDELAGPLLAHEWIPAYENSLLLHFMDSTESVQTAPATAKFTAGSSNLGAHSTLSPRPPVSHTSSLLVAKPNAELVDHVFPPSPIQPTCLSSSSASSSSSSSPSSSSSSSSSSPSSFSTSSSSLLLPVLEPSSDRVELGSVSLAETEPTAMTEHASSITSIATVGSSAITTTATQHGSAEVLKLIPSTQVVDGIPANAPVSTTTCTRAITTTATQHGSAKVKSTPRPAPKAQPPKATAGDVFLRKSTRNHPKPAVKPRPAPSTTKDLRAGIFANARGIDMPAPVSKPQSLEAPSISPTLAPAPAPAPSPTPIAAPAVTPSPSLAPALAAALTPRAPTTGTSSPSPSLANHAITEAIGSIAPTSLSRVIARLPASRPSTTSMPAGTVTSEVSTMTEEIAMVENTPIAAPSAQYTASSEESTMAEDEASRQALRKRRCSDLDDEGPASSKRKMLHTLQRDAVATEVAVPTLSPSHAAKGTKFASLKKLPPTPPRRKTKAPSRATSTSTWDSFKKAHVRASTESSRRHSTAKGMLHIPLSPTPLSSPTSTLCGDLFVEDALDPDVMTGYPTDVDSSGSLYLGSDSQESDSDLPSTPLASSEERLVGNEVMMRDDEVEEVTESTSLDELPEQPKAIPALAPAKVHVSGHRVLKPTKSILVNAGSTASSTAPKGKLHDIKPYARPDKVKKASSKPDGLASLASDFNSALNEILAPAVPTFLAVPAPVIDRSRDPRLRARALREAKAAEDAKLVSL
ncbi:uncharacterized protein EHS24_002770 [Apiotrichum porosum]|uniref:Uncharacterized protein n=1 Tax=Apiotrichum porosum TaxID=105984 RepID=A0A427XHE4_9TREE|nr:uncharacterized protein EHS24_002770 [Apiotrichum porosum]RSH78301.1 hypothetical protein EHS24_002770 [Apiotrichum porosum]